MSNEPTIEHDPVTGLPRSPFSDPNTHPDTPNIVGGPGPAAPEPPDTFDDDTLIRRDDLGVGAYTFVAKGEAIPRGLIGLSSRPAKPSAPARGTTASPRKR